MNDREQWLEKMRSIGTPRGAGDTRRTIERHDKGVVITTEHGDGRQDVEVRPATQHYKAEVHRTGRKRGQVAEIRKKEARP